MTIQTITTTDGKRIGNFDPDTGHLVVWEGANNIILDTMVPLDITSVQLINLVAYTSKMVPCAICAANEVPVPSDPEIDPVCQTCIDALDNGADIEDIQSAARLNDTQYTAFGEQKTWVEWLKDPRCKVNSVTLRRRIHTDGGWGFEEALATPTMNKGPGAHKRSSADLDEG